MELIFWTHNICRRGATCNQILHLTKLGECNFIQGPPCLPQPSGVASGRSEIFMTTHTAGLRWMTYSLFAVVANLHVRIVHRLSICHWDTDWLSWDLAVCLLFEILCDVCDKFWLQAITYPELAEYQEKAWQAVVPIVLQLKRYYEFSLALGQFFVALFISFFCTFVLLLLLLLLLSF